MGFNIAIDGPAGAGKSTIAKLVAGQTEYASMWIRAQCTVALLYIFLENRIDPSDINAVIRCL